MALDKASLGVSPAADAFKPTQATGAGGIAGKAQLGIDAFEFKRALKDLEAQKNGERATGVASGSAGEKLKFSSHAIERMRSRGISFQPEEMRSIESAVAKAAAKGSKDTLVLTGESAMIVSVKNNTIVTVMDKAAMKENVFTNIDSTVVI